MMIALVISVMLAILMLMTTNYYQMMLNQLATQRNRIYALQVMQDMGILAQKANDYYIRNSSSCGSSGYTQEPATKPFCWNMASTTANCVREPRANTDASKQNVCIDFATGNVVRLSMIQEVGPKNWLEKVRYTAGLIYEYREQVASRIFSDLNGLFGNEAHALELHWPAITAPPTIPSFSTVVTCDYATSYGPTSPCKKCQELPAGTPPKDQNVECLEIRVCLRSVGGGGCDTSNYDEWFTQTIGIMSRD